MTDNQPTGAEQRAHPRIDLKLPVQFEFDDEVFDVQSVNVSAGGMLVELDHAPPEQMALNFRIWLRDDDDRDEPLELKGTVVRFGGGTIAIRFDRMDSYAAELAALERYLTDHEPPAGEEAPA